MRGTGVREAGKPVSDKNQQMTENPTWVTPSSHQVSRPHLHIRKVIEKTYRGGTKQKIKEERSSKGKGGRGAVGKEDLDASIYSPFKHKT